MRDDDGTYGRPLNAAAQFGSCFQCETLRARAEKAEAAAADQAEYVEEYHDAYAKEIIRADQWKDAALRAERERNALRDGIQALADEYERTRKAPYHLIAAAYVAEALRGLLSPTPEGDNPAE